MRVSRRYLTAVVLLAVFAVGFGVFGTFAPPLAEENILETQQESSSETVGHFTNPPTYDSGWVDIRTKCGRYIPIMHRLNTTNVTFDVTGKQSLDPEGGSVEWLRTYGETLDDSGHSAVQTVDEGYAIAGSTASFSASSDFYLVKTDAYGNKQWHKNYGGSNDDEAHSVVNTADEGYALAGQTESSGVDADFWLVKTDAFGGQMWNQTYDGGIGDDSCNSIVQTNDWGFALAGSTSTLSNGVDSWLVRTNASGAVLWNKTYGGLNADYGCSTVCTADEGYAIAGYSNSFGADYDFWLVKTDSDGSLLWSQTYDGGVGNDYCWSVVQTGDGGYVLAGYSSSATAGYDFWLLKTDTSGNHQWNRTYGSSSDDYGRSVVQTTDLGYAIAGYTYSSGTDFDCWLVKTDSSGYQQWNKTYGGTDNDYGHSVLQTTDQGYAIAGFLRSYGIGGSDSWLIKVRSDRDLEHFRNLGETTLINGWSRVYDFHLSDDTAFSVVQTSDGGYAMAGETCDWSYAYDFALVKTDSSGNLQWNRTYDSGDDDYGRSVVQTSDQGYVAAGYAHSAATNDDFWLIKTDAEGWVMWEQKYGGSGNDRAHSVVQTFDGGYAIAGETNSFGLTSYDFYLVKTDAGGNLQWNKTYGGANIDYGFSVIQTSDGGYAIVGYTKSFGVGTPAYPNVYLVKTDADGIMAWNKTYGGANIDYGFSVIQTSDGGYAIAGMTETKAFGQDYDFYLIETDADGNMQWSKKYGLSRSDIGQSLIETPDGGYAIGGSAEEPSGPASDAVLLRTDSSGNLQWSQTYGPRVLIQNDDEVYAIAYTKDKGFVMAGRTYSYDHESYDFWLIKTDVENGLACTALTESAVTLYRGKTDVDWNYVRVRMWLIKEPSWIYGDINMDGIVDVKDLYIVGRNYGKTFSLLSLSGIIAVAGIHTIKKRKQTKQPSYIS